jgi:hypothetical protein
MCILVYFFNNEESTETLFDRLHNEYNIHPEK